MKIDWRGLLLWLVLIPERALLRTQIAWIGWRLSKQNRYLTSLENEMKPYDEFLAKIRATPQEKLLLILRRRGIFVHPETPKDEIARLLNFQLGFDESKEPEDQ